MGEWFIGEIRAFSIGWAPEGWHPCDGSILSVQSNQALFALLGNTFGGVYPNTFGLPDLRGRTILGGSTAGGTYPRGIAGGAEKVPLTEPQMPLHTHEYKVLNAYGTVTAAANNTVSGPNTNADIPVSPNIFAPGTATLPLNPNTLEPTGGGTGHENMQPSLVIGYYIATNGIFPPRN